MKYRFNHYKTKDGKMHTICISHFAGKEVRGFSTCSLEDDYNEDLGNKIAQLRCDEKIAEKRVKCAVARSNTAITRVSEAKLELLEASDYLVESEEELRMIRELLTDTLNEANA